MGKRKNNSDDCDRIQRKIRKLEKKLERKRRRRQRSRSVEDLLSSRSSSCLSDKQDYNYRRLSDEDNAVFDEISTPVQENSDPIPICVEDNAARTTIPSVVTVPKNDEGPSTLKSTDHATPGEPVTVEYSSNNDKELLDILGIDPTTDKKYGKELHKDLSVRLQHWTTSGLDKDIKKELKDRYLTPANCKLLDPPILNAEMKAAISDINVKRDKAIEGKQKMLTLGITSLGEAITLLLESKDKDTSILKLLMDSMRFICDCQHADTITRRNFVVGGLKKEIKEQLQNTSTDKYLFGENLAETLKSAKAICKTGTELKPSAPKNSMKKPAPSTSSATRHLNWQNPGPSRRPTGPPRMKQPASTLTNSRLSNSSKPLQHQQRPAYNRR